MAASENVTFKPAFEGVLTQHLHNAPGDIEFTAVRVFRFVFGKPCFLRSGIDRCEPVGGSLVWSKDSEGTHVATHHLGKEVCEHIGGRSIGRARCLYYDGIVAKIWQF